MELSLENTIQAIASTDKDAVIAGLASEPSGLRFTLLISFSGTASLENHKKRPGFPLSLIKLLCTPNLTQNIQDAIAIQLKNFIIIHWDDVWTYTE